MVSGDQKWCANNPKRHKTAPRKRIIQPKMSIMPGWELTLEIWVADIYATKGGPLHLSSVKEVSQFEYGLHFHC